jgi:signal transduction histidine kinase
MAIRFEIGQMERGAGMARDAAEAGSGERPFSLVRWFALLGLGCIAAAAIGSALLLTHFLTRQMLQRDAEVSADFTQSMVAVGQSFAYFEDRAAPDARQGLEAFLSNISQWPDVVRANVFAADGTVLWSSNAQLIGRRGSGTNLELASALNGHIAVQSGVIGETTKSEYTSFGIEAKGLRFVEAYLPVWDAERRRVIGVVEIYRLPASLFRSIDAGVRMVWAGALASAVFLYLTLFWMIRRADRQLRLQREQLVEAETMATVGAFASAVAHGVRNPLAAMRSSAELALEEPDATARQAMLTDILREADRLGRWVRDLLLGARGEAMAPGAVDVNALLAESARSFATVAGQRSIRLSLRSQLVPPAQAEAGLLARAIDNILANAIEATPQGGEVLIESRADRAHGLVEIRIADTGRGMPSVGGRRLIRPFHSTKPQGTGLGLVLARRIVASYAGSLLLESAEGRGTTVTIRLQPALG